MRIAFFHGLESSYISDKSEFLKKKFDDPFIPDLNYREDKNLFFSVLVEVEKRKPDLLIGSSMGGWFAYCMATCTGIPTLLFNPALHSRSIEVHTQILDKKGRHKIILGLKDTVIDPIKTKSWVHKNGIGYFEFHEYEALEHRIPLDVFQECISGYI